MFYIVFAEAGATQTHGYATLYSIFFSVMALANELMKLVYYR